jgi:hypothetical protein
MASGHLTLLYVGSENCHNCTSFDPEWKKIEDLHKEGKLKHLSVDLKKIKIEPHAQLPPALRETVSFYPFILLLPTRYYQENSDREDFVLVGEALYAYKKMVNGRLEYRFCENVQDSPSMRYPRTAEGIQSWMEDLAIEAVKTLAPRYYPEVLESIGKTLRQRNLKVVDWQAEKERFSKDMLLIPSLNKSYKMSSGGVVIHQRIRNTHD